MRVIFGLLGLFFTTTVLASGGASSGTVTNLGLTGNALGLLCVLIFVLAYAFVMVEEFIHLPKSKPVILAAGLIWILVAYLSATHQADSVSLETVIEHNLLEYAALFLFLLVAMTYINAMTERNVFEAMRCWLIRRQFGYRKLFWITGTIAFFLSPIADNLTTALLMGAVVLSVGSDSPKFVALGCINIVVAANAGGAFSPFGDITTLMVWQSGHATFFEFFALFLPAVANFIVPATLMSFAVPDEHPQASSNEDVPMKRGALIICLLFICTIATAVSFEQFLHLPPK